MGFQIAIDGPAGAGKSTIAKRIAKELGFTYMDTGAMYRAIGLLFSAEEVFPESEEQIENICKRAQIGLRYIDGVQHVFLNGEDVSGAIRTEQAGLMASKVSTLPAVRKKLVELQQEISASMDVVMDGRDIGTVVLPDAELKIFMEADPNVRAQRRFLELKEKGQDPDLSQILSDLLARDEQDRNRAASPLKQAEDAVLLDTSAMNIEEVTDAILKMYQERIK